MGRRQTDRDNLKSGLPAFPFFENCCHASRVGKAPRGSRFVPITEDGFPASDVQVSNLDTREEAAAYAAMFGFEVVDTVIN
jgi:hypothetical protein